MNIKRHWFSLTLAGILIAFLLEYGIIGGWQKVYARGFMKPYTLTFTVLILASHLIYEQVFLRVHTSDNLIIRILYITIPVTGVVTVFFKYYPYYEIVLVLLILQASIFTVYGIAKKMKERVRKRKGEKNES